MSPVRFPAAAVILLSQLSLSASAAENFKKENLVAWCIVPFDAKKRGPEARAQMLVDLGIRRCAYDWRAEHVAGFEEEILRYKKHGIEFFAFWNEHPSAFALFEKHGIHPQIWKTCPSPAKGSQEEKVAAATKAMLPLAEKTKALRCKLGLYNHGGWGGEPGNLVAVCRALRAMGHDHVGIVYNFHHGHGHIADFEKALATLTPHLLCLNLNGMADPATVKGRQNKILPIGSGVHEKAMIRTVLASGYNGPIGILDHLDEVDAAVALKRNLDGLEGILHADPQGSAD